MSRKMLNNILANLVVAGITGVSFAGLVSQNETKKIAPEATITTAQISPSNSASNLSLFKQTNIPTAELAREYLSDDFRSTPVKSLAKDRQAQSR